MMDRTFNKEFVGSTLNCFIFTQQQCIDVSHWLYRQMNRQIAALLKDPTTDILSSYYPRNLQGYWTIRHQIRTECCSHLFIWH